MILIATPTGLSKTLSVAYNTYLFVAFFNFTSLKREPAILHFQIELLKDVLLAWKAEVEKKPPAMSVDDAYEVLGLARGTTHPETSVRKSYYRLAQQYHPDKNAGGRVN